MSSSTRHKLRLRRAILGGCAFVGMSMINCSSSTCPAGRQGETGACLAPVSRANATTADDQDASERDIDAG
jgi:hypothetical protein